MTVEVPAPADPAAHPRVLMAELAALVGESTAALACADLLGGAEPADHLLELRFLAGRALPGLLAGRWPSYWSRVWGARGLRYVWDDRAAPAVLAGLGDTSWRVGEMCLRVAALRSLPAGDGAVLLSGHELPRVRAAAVRALGIVGDTEHSAAVVDALDDPDPDVRRSAALALDRMHERLDLPRPS